MTCEQQPEIDLDSYDTFRRGLMGTPSAPGPLLLDEWNPVGFNPSVRFLDLWGRANGYLSCATWTKKLLLELTRNQPRGEMTSATRRLTQTEGRASMKLLLAFGHTFQGDEVGAPGRDIVEYALKHRVQDLRATAVVVLECWLEDDEYGTWLDVLNDHIDFEPDRQLKNQCKELVQAWMEEELEEMLGDDEDPPELEEYFEVGRRLPNRARAQLETRALPEFLEKLVDVDQRLALAVLESVNIGKLVAEDTRYGFLLSRVGGGWQLHCWHLDGKSSFSIEPTATDGNWLVFARF